MRLRPVSALNKHLLPVYDKPMIMYGIESLREAGITDIYVSISLFNPFGFMDVLRDGRELGVNLSFLVQNTAGGIAYAVNSAKPWLGDEPFIVYLGDNIFTLSLKPYVEKFMNQAHRVDVKPMVLLKKATPTAVEALEEVRRYGVAKFQEPYGPSIDLRSLGRKPEILEFVEKPEKPPSQYILLGVYFLTPQFFQVFPKMKPSKRGEYEITDALNLLMPVDYEVYEGVWWDCGEFKDILNAAKFMEELKNMEERKG